MVKMFKKIKEETTKQICYMFSELKEDINKQMKIVINKMFRVLKEISNVLNFKSQYRI